jgi:hypothetical protein
MIRWMITVLGQEDPVDYTRVGSDLLQSRSIEKIRDFIVNLPLGIRANERL